MAGFDYPGLEFGPLSAGVDDPGSLLPGDDAGPELEGFDYPGLESGPLAPGLELAGVDYPGPLLPGDEFGPELSGPLSPGESPGLEAEGFLRLSRPFFKAAIYCD